MIVILRLGEVLIDRKVSLLHSRENPEPSLALGLAQLAGVGPGLGRLHPRPSCGGVGDSVVAPTALLLGSRSSLVDQVLVGDLGLVLGVLLVLLSNRLKSFILEPTKPIEPTLPRLTSTLAPRIDLSVRVVIVAVVLWAQLVLLGLLWVAFVQMPWFLVGGLVESILLQQVHIGHKVLG